MMSATAAAAAAAAAAVVQRQQRQQKQQQQQQMNLVQPGLLAATTAANVTVAPVSSMCGANKHRPLFSSYLFRRSDTVPTCRTLHRWVNSVVPIHWRQLQTQRQWWVAQQAIKL